MMNECIRQYSRLRMKLSILRPIERLVARDECIAKLLAGCFNPLVLRVARVAGRKCGPIRIIHGGIANGPPKGSPDDPWKKWDYRPGLVVRNITKTFDLLRLSSAIWQSSMLVLL